VSTSTARALLVLPDPTENYSVTIVNANMTALDSHLGFAPFTSSTRPASAFSGRTIRETDTERLYYSRGTAPISASWVQVLTEGASANIAASASFMIGGDTRIRRLGAASLSTTGAWQVEGNETVIGTTTASGAVTMNSSLTVNGNPSTGASASLAGWGGVWGTWSPTLTNVTLGTGSTVTARYFQMGKLVFVQLQIVLGSSGADVTGELIFSLPVTARATTPIVWGSGIVLDASAVGGHRSVIVQAKTTTTASLINYNGGPVDAANPFDWTNSDQVRVAFFYEAA
jgi:hypothetical protein